MTSADIRNLVKKSLQDALKNTYQKVATFFGGGVTVFSYFASSYKGMLYGVMAYAVVYYFMVNAYLIRNIAYYYSSSDRKNIYGESIKYMNTAFAIIHQLQRLNSNKSNEILRYLSEFCTQIQIFFAKKADSDCSVSIKLMLEQYPNSEDIEIVTLCRDQVNMKREKSNKDIHHVINANSAFSHITTCLPKKESDLNKLCQRYYLTANLTRDGKTEV